MRRAYIEPTGDVSVIKRKEHRPGLLLLPTFDDEIRQNDNAEKDEFACFSCGKIRESKTKPTEACERCGCKIWTEAINTVEI